MKSCTLQWPKSSNVGYKKLLLIQYIYINKKTSRSTLSRLESSSDDTSWKLQLSYPCETNLSKIYTQTTHKTSVFDSEW